MKIIYLKEVTSTQAYLKKLIREDSIELPHAVIANIQTDGMGSRDNKWQGIEGNLFLSFAMSLDKLPKDLKLESSSIYFSYILKDILTEEGSKIWLKWPNDFYINNKKIGGMITNIVGDTLICGLGLNLEKSPEGFDILDIRISKDTLVKKYFKNIEKSFLWKQIFSKYRLEFYKSKNFFTHENNRKISLNEATLQDDGSIIINNERMYSLR